MGFQLRLTHRACMCCTYADLAHAHAVLQLQLDTLADGAVPVEGSHHPAIAGADHALGVVILTCTHASWEGVYSLRWPCIAITRTGRPCWRCLSRSVSHG